MAAPGRQGPAGAGHARLPPFGGALSLRALLAAATFSVVASGCVRDAVLENDVQNAERKARVLASVSDCEHAEAVLAAQLVELEALYLRSPRDRRVLELLGRGYFRMAGGFLEARRLEALAAGDAADASYQARRQEDARARASFYRSRVGPLDTPETTLAVGQSLGAQLRLAEAACQAHDRLRHDAVLTALLAQRDPRPEKRLELALAQRLARSLLKPEVSARCQFAAATPAALAAP